MKKNLIIFMAGMFSMLILMLISSYKAPNLAYSAQKQHRWEKGAFYILAAKNFEEASDKHPTKYIQVEVCMDCGLIRLPSKYIGYGGEDLGE